MSGKKFRFSLKSVRDVRRHETEQARQALGRARRAVAAQEKALAAARRHLADLAGQAPTGKALGPHAFRRHDAFRQAAQEACEAAAAKLEKLRREEEQARRALVERRRAEEAIETLHDQEADRFRKERDAAETAFLDEQALTGYLRQRSNPTNR